MEQLKAPLITVYITNYNYGKYLEQAIKSVLDQSFCDFELLIIDDGSTDDSREIIGCYEEVDNVRVFYQHNQGLPRTNNLALKQARGKYITRLDADDFFTPDALFKLVSKIDSDPDLVAVWPDYFEIDADGQMIRRVSRHNFDIDVTLFDQPAHGACTMFRVDALEQMGGYDESLSRQDGFDLWLRLIKIYKVSNVSECLFYYRRHAESLTGNEAMLLQTRATILRKAAASAQEKEPVVLAIVPVRGETIDPRQQPIRLLGSKPLLDWTLDSLLISDKIGVVVVSTPDVDVERHLQDHYEGRLICHRRSADAARPHHSLSQTIADVLLAFSDKYAAPDIVVVVNIEYPFRGTYLVESAIDYLTFFETDSVIGVRHDDAPFYLHDGSGLRPRRDEELRIERDDLYKRVGGITGFSRLSFERNGTLLGETIGHIFVDEKAAVRVATELDWKLASSIVT